MNDQINIIQNYISKDSCSFMNKAFENYLTETPDPLTLAGPSGWIGVHRYSNIFLEINDNFAKLPNKSFPYENNFNYNVSIDLFLALLNNIAKTVSDFYEEEYLIRSFFYGCMLQGSSNDLHMDNYYLDLNTNQITPRNTARFDKSAILYLSDDYEGGEICFPLQKICLKPDPGTLIFFDGNNSLPHEVKTVKSGKRKNLIIFLIKKDNIDTISNKYDINEIVKEPQKRVTLEAFSNQM